MKKLLSLIAAALLSLCIVPFTACNDGRDGTNGTNGEDGVGIERVYINDDGELIVVLTDGKELNAGKTDIYEGLYYSEIIEEGEVTAYSVRSIGNLSTGKIEIPSTYKGKPVTEIGEGAFLSCKLLREVTIPDSVTTICRYAFENCSNLAELSLGKGIEKIGDVAFGYCISLTAVTIPSSVRYIGSDAFSGCTALKDVRIEEGVERMGRSVFSGCERLEEITFPESLKEVGIDYEYTDGGYTISIVTDGDYSMVGMFMNCGSLKRVHLPEQFPEIPEHFFSGCFALEEVYLGKSITKIGYSSFYLINAMQSLVIPKSVKEVASYAFYHVNSLQDVYYEGSEEEWNAIKINRNNEISGYDPDTGMFTNGTTRLYFYSETQPESGSNCWHYVDGQPVKW